MGLVGLPNLSARSGKRCREPQDIHSLDGNRSPILNDHLVNLGVASKVQVRVDGTGCMDVSMSAVAATASLKAVSV